MPRPLGQHFLIRDSILERIATAACGKHTPRVIEIGPGKGALTRHLLPYTDELHAIEIDDALIPRLRSAFAAEPKLHLHHASVLETDLSQWGGAIVTGNLPYYITSPIIDQFLSLDHRFPRAVFLMQREVGDRVMAVPGTRAYGLLSVATQLICEVELVCYVPASAFHPPPKVESAALHLIRKPVTPPHAAEIVRFAARCFAHKRKTLRNNLRPFYGPLADGLQQANLRAEQLPVEKFIALHRELEEKQQANSTPFVH